MTAINSSFLMQVEDVVAITGRETMVTGTIESGVVKIGDLVEIVGLEPGQITITVPVCDIQMFRHSRDQAEAGQSVGIGLKGVKKEQIERGMVVATPGSVTPS